MRGIADSIADLIQSFRLATAGQWALRTTLLLSLVGAGLLCLWWWPVLGSGLLLVFVVVCALWSVGQPDSWAPLVGTVGIAVWWLAGAAGASWWQTLVVALLLAVFHLTSAHAASAPSYTQIRRGAVAVLGSRALAYLGACAVGAGLVFVVAAVPAGVVPRGLWWIALGLGVVVAAAVVVTPRLRR